MTIRAVENGDWTFGNGLQDYKSGDEEIMQDVKSRILSFWGDCFFDMDFGINWFGLLGYRGQQELETAIQSMILTTNGVVGINSFSASYTADRQLRLSFDIKTVNSESYKATLSLSEVI